MSLSSNSYRYIRHSDATLNVILVSLWTTTFCNITLTLLSKILLKGQIVQNQKVFIKEM